MLFFSRRNVPNVLWWDNQPFFFFSYYCAWHLQNITLISAWHTRAKKIRERSQSNDATHIYIQLKWFQSGSWLNWVTWSKRCRVLYPALMKQTCLQQSTPLPILINLLSLWDTVYFCCLFYMVDLCGITICNFLCFFFKKLPLPFFVVFLFFFCL